MLDTYIRSTRAVTHHVHLVNPDNELPNPECSDKQCVLPGLAPSVEACFKFSRSSIDHKEREISLRSSGNHVGNEILMPRRVQKSEGSVRSVEVTGGDIYRYASEMRIARVSASDIPLLRSYLSLSSPSASRPHAMAKLDFPTF